MSEGDCGGGGANPRLSAAPGRSGGVNHTLAGENVTVTPIFNGKWS